MEKKCEAVSLFPKKIELSYFDVMGAHEINDYVHGKGSPGEFRIEKKYTLHIKMKRLLKEGTTIVYAVPFRSKTLVGRIPLEAFKTKTKTIRGIDEDTGVSYMIWAEQGGYKDSIYVNHIRLAFQNSTIGNEFSKRKTMYEVATNEFNQNSKRLGEIEKEYDLVIQKKRRLEQEIDQAFSKLKEV